MEYIKKIKEWAAGKTDMGESDYLDNCFACNNNIDIHKL